MISFSLGPLVEYVLVVREAGRSTSMMAADRSTVSRRAILILTILIGLPRVAHSASLEDAAKELARKASAVFSAGDSVSIETHNRSSLSSDEVERIEQAFKTELRERGTHVIESGGAAAQINITLSENWKELVWTGEIRQGGVSHVVLVSAPRAGKTHFAANAMHVTVRSEKFWEGPERVLDAEEISNGSGNSWFLLLLPSKLSIQDLQTGSTSKVDLPIAPPAIRDPFGKLGTLQVGNSISLDTASQVCSVDLAQRAVTGCFSATGQSNNAAPNSISILYDLAPEGAPPPGKGMELVIAPVCGGTNQFLATSARDDTQPDSLQVFQSEPNGPVAMSGELDFPGPIVALHSSVDAPRAIARNLATGNYEAYRLDISCGQ